MQNSTQLDDLFEKAQTTSNEDEAIAIYNNLLLQQPEWDTVHYNLGLIYKYRKEWEKSYHHNKTAQQLNPENEASRWNLGIAATMVGDWKVARECWNAFGMSYEIADRDTANEQHIGAACVRINSDDGEAETIWVTRICPTRAVLDSIPLPQSNHNFRDIVLNDGAPNGKRIFQGKEYTVFDEIQHLVVSDYQTCSIKVKSLSEEQYMELRTRCRAADIAVENWTTGITVLCKQCSEGTPHEIHDAEMRDLPEEHKIALATTSLEKLETILEKWADETGADYHDPRYYE